MNLSIKTTEYALLPTKAVPLDPREHFDNLGKAVETIRGKVIASDSADTTDGNGKIFYIGEIISTKEDGVYQVQTGNLTLYRENGTNVDLYWSKSFEESNKAPFKIKQIKNADNTITTVIQYTRDTSYTYEYTSDIDNYEYTIADFPLKPISSGGGGGASLYINPNGGLQNPSTGLSLKIDDSSKNNLTLSSNGLKLSGVVLSVNNQTPDSKGNISLSYIKSAEVSNIGGQKLTLTDSNSNSTALNFGDGLKLSSVSGTSDFTLSINAGENIKITDGKLDVGGIHHYTVTDDESKSIKIGDFAYQLIK